MPEPASATPAHDRVSTPPPASLASHPLARGAVLAVALLLLASNITRPFVGHHEWNSAMYAVFARNHVEYGLRATKLFCTWGDTPTLPAEPQRYLSHPPLIAAWAAIPLFIFGDHEWAARLVPILATLGSIWLLMVIISRLQSPTLGLLSGFFYAVLPITAYFGRMLDHVPLIQFFSLLMLHGYLHASGRYGPDSRPKAGAIQYLLGVVLGIGTGWGALIMAALLWLWHAPRALCDPPTRRLQLWLTLIPAVSLVAVVLHILWGCHWDLNVFGPLIASRSFGAVQSHEAMPWGQWLAHLWTFAQQNVSVLGLGAAVVYLLLIPTILWRAAPDSPLRSVARSGPAVTPLFIILLQGLLYIVAFKNQSWTHDYWQFFAAPFVATALGAVVLTCHTLLSRIAPRAAGCAAALLVLLPMPLLARSLDDFRQQQDFPSPTVDAFVRLAQLVPPRVPVFTSASYPEFSEPFGKYTNRWPIPQIAYYAHRPLVHCTNLSEIEANPRHCPAYLLEVENDPSLAQLARTLGAKYETITVNQQYLIFLLNRPRHGPP